MTEAWGILSMDQIKQLPPDIAKQLADALQGPIDQASLEGKIKDISAFEILDALRARAESNRRLM